MQNKSSKLESDIIWIKADKAYPKKSLPLVTSLNNINIKTHSTNSSLNSNGFSLISNESDNSKFKLHDQETNRLVGMKDLCPEDKQRIANLIKELAKVAEEKRQLEVSLEEERKKKDNEIKEVLDQHQLLLSEKEKILIKYKKTQEKLEQIKRHQKLMKLESKCLPLKPEKNPQLEVIKQNPFNPYTSSTPMSQSPRSLSPIPIRINSALSSDSKPLVEEIHMKNDCLEVNEDSKKMDLIKQRMDLLNEQKQLKEMLDQQEKLLKEKQDQIFLQQKLHRERLEQLVQIKNFEIEKQQQQHQQMLIATSMVNSNNFNKSSNNLDLDQQQQINNHLNISKNDLNNHYNCELIDKIAQKVYKQLKIKRHETSNEINEDELLSTSCGSCKKRDKLVDETNNFLINDIKHNKQVKKAKDKVDRNVQSNPGNNIKLKQSNNNIFINSSKDIVVDDNDDDLEESKLIEDLFFLK